MKEISEFPSSVFEHLKYYVYLLKDPINNEIFYVGKGNGNRIFSHLNFALSNPERSDKLNKIRAIRKRGEEVEHIVLRHGLSEKEAFEVEAAILDFVDFLSIEGLTNLVLGRESEERGYMTTSDIIAQYAAKRIDITEPSILVRVNRLYKIGMNAESKSVKFFDQLHKNTLDSESKDILLRLKDQEVEHYKLLKDFLEELT